MAPDQQNSLGRGRYRSFASEPAREDEEGQLQEALARGDEPSAPGRGWRRVICKAALPIAFACVFTLCAAVGAVMLWTADARRYSASRTSQRSMSETVGLQAVPPSGAAPPVGAPPVGAPPVGAPPSGVPQGVPGFGPQTPGYAVGASGVPPDPHGLPSAGPAGAPAVGVPAFGQQVPAQGALPAAGARPWPPAAPAAIPGVPTQHPALQWLDCEDFGDAAIIDATPYCTQQGSVAHHCLTVLRLSGGTTAMVELGGWCGHSVVTCRTWKEDGNTVNMHLNRMSSVSGEEWWTQKDTKPASYSGRIGTYAHDGFGPDQYAMTLKGLKDWSLAYVNMFPDYKFFTANCQKYNIAVYNCVTHSREAGDQEFWSNIINPVAKFASNVVGQDLTEDQNPACQPGGAAAGIQATGQR